MSDTTYWGALGDLAFTTSQTPTVLSGSSKQRLSEIKPIRGLSRYQNFGTESRELKMAFVFDQLWCIPREELTRLQLAMREAKPLFLAFGEGKFNGWYHITSLNTDIAKTLPSGEISTMRVGCTLKETSDRDLDSVTLESSPYVSVR